MGRLRDATTPVDLSTMPARALERYRQRVRELIQGGKKPRVAAEEALQHGRAGRTVGALPTSENNAALPRRTGRRLSLRESGPHDEFTKSSG